MDYELEARWEERWGPSTDRPKDNRGQYVRDRARIIHSAAFRRLQAKTQVLGIGEGDFHRTRLTHSLEVAQVARGIVFHLKKVSTANWLPGLNLIEAIALAHDLGHPPFGHGGEVALNYLMQHHGGFEGNGQTLRILARLEAHTDEHGLNLTRRSLLGVLKYPVAYSAITKTKYPDSQQNYISAHDWKPPKCYMNSESEIVQWILSLFPDEDRTKFQSLKKQPSADEHGKSKYKALDTSIMELADDIAYGVHDLEDAIALGFINKTHLSTLNVDQQWAEELGIKRDSLIEDLARGGGARKKAIGALVHAFINSTELTKLNEFSHPLLDYNAKFTSPANELIEQLKKLVVSHVIKTPQVQTLEFRGQQLIIEMFRALDSDPERLLTASFRDQLLHKSTPDEKKRVLCDFIAGMTDEYATRIYERLFIPRHGQVFDRL